MQNSQDIQSMLCMACLCVGRSLRELKDDRLKQYYLETLNEIPLCSKPMTAPMVCWECAALLKKVLSFREQVKDSYRILQTYTHENLYECLLTDVSRSPRLKVHVNDPVIILPTTSYSEGEDAIKEEIKVEWCNVSENENHTAADCTRIGNVKDPGERVQALPIVEHTKERHKKRKQVNSSCHINKSKSLQSRSKPLKVLEPDTSGSKSDRLATCLAMEFGLKECKKEDDNPEFNGLEIDDHVSDVSDEDVEVESESHVLEIKKQRTKMVRSKISNAKKIVKRLKNVKKINNSCNINKAESIPPRFKRLHDLDPDMSGRKSDQLATCLDVEFGSKDCKKEDENSKLNNLEISDHVSNLLEVEVEVANVNNVLEDKKQRTKMVRNKISNAQVVKRLKNVKKITNPQKVASKQKILTLELTYEEMLAEREREAKRDVYTKAEYKCVTCLIGFHYQKSYKAHLVAKHSPGSGDYSCPICKTIISSVEAFTAHYKKHMRRYECSICGKRTADVKAMQQHYHSSHEITLKQYKCNLCGLVSNSIDTHRYHKDTHKARVQCDECEKTFSHRAGLMNHRLAVHELKNVFPCTVCDKVFRWKTSLRRHLEKHDVKTATPADGAYCAECDIAFASVCSLQRHLRNSLKHVTQDQFKFICDHCNRRFVDKTKIRDHIEEKHLHWTHQCHICHKTYKNRVGLDQHVRNVHKGRPINKMCHHCGKGFPTKVQLESHMRTHTGERPFICEYCPTTFSQQSNLYKHHKQVHLNIKSKRYPLCNKKRRPDGNRTDDPSSTDCANGHIPVVIQYTMSENIFGL